MSNIIIAVDLCPKDRVATLFDEGKYEDVLSEVNPYKLSTKNTRWFDLFHPYTNSYLCGLYCRGVLPSFVSKKLMTNQNKIECESHLERLSYVIQYNLK